jgi:hypothetical protein
VDFPLLSVENAVFWRWDERFLAGKIIKMGGFFSKSCLMTQEARNTKSVGESTHAFSTPNPQWPYL